MPDDLPLETPNRTLPGEVLDLILAGYWDWNIPENAEYLSPEFKRMFGYEDHELPNSPETWQKLIFPRRSAASVRAFPAARRESCRNSVRSGGSLPAPQWVDSLGDVQRQSDRMERNRSPSPDDRLPRRYNPPQAPGSRTKRERTRWKFALEGAGDGVWDWNAVTNTVFYSRQWKTMLGYTEEDIGESLDEWSKRSIQPTMPRVREELDLHISGKIPIYSSEHRIQCKDGSYKWVLDRGQVISRAPDGTPLRIIGTHSDISDRKAQAEIMEQLSLVAANTETESSSPI